MKTCGFCATELIKGSYCEFCDMHIDTYFVSKNGERINQSDKFLGYPNSSKIHLKTNDLMMLETIELLCLLREARSHRADAYNLRLLRHKAEEHAGYTDDVMDLDKKSYEEYEYATRKVWVIENIIKSRLGYFPKKVTNNFLHIYLENMKNSETKMFIKSKILK